LYQEIILNTGFEIKKGISPRENGAGCILALSWVEKSGTKALGDEKVVPTAECHVRARWRRLSSLWVPGTFQSPVKNRVKMPSSPEEFHPRLFEVFCDSYYLAVA
jgi:hypothetical protein